MEVRRNSETKEAEESWEWKQLRRRFGSNRRGGRGGLTDKKDGTLLPGNVLEPGGYKGDEKEEDDSRTS